MSGCGHPAFVGWRQQLRPVTDAMVLLPRGRIHETYRRVAGDIRSRVVRAQEAREREQRRDAREAATPAAPTRRDLFDLLKAGG